VSESRRRSLLWNRRSRSVESNPNKGRRPNLTFQKTTMEPGQVNSAATRLDDLLMKDHHRIARSPAVEFNKYAALTGYNERGYNEHGYIRVTIRVSPRASITRPSSAASLPLPGFVLEPSPLQGAKGRGSPQGGTYLHTLRKAIELRRRLFRGPPPLSPLHLNLSPTSSVPMGSSSPRRKSSERKTTHALYAPPKIISPTNDPHGSSPPRPVPPS
jgi:hypothetical protein